ncbi:kinase-like protein [Diplodia corticola]|uniref:Kinase-like protein n=1 Tax=Diplodia corticola TaxID=236234 RepID=A0A1J9QPW0_9PEZI|nr:kinase-like protein [Diplodia corticola]OJD30497.1 kinase-like protein [Diplodia corticola]
MFGPKLEVHATDHGSTDSNSSIERLKGISFSLFDKISSMEDATVPSDSAVAASSCASGLPEYNISTIDFANAAATPSTRASFNITSTPTTTSSKLKRRHQVMDRVKRVLSISTLRGSRSTSMRGTNSSSSTGLLGAGTSDTSVEGDTPPRALPLSSVPTVAITTPTSDGSNTGSRTASMRTIHRLNPLFLSPRSARTRARSPHYRRSMSPSPSPRAGFPRRMSSLRHSNEFPFNPNSPNPRTDDSHLYQSSPTSPVSERSRLPVPPPFQSPGGAASSPALVANSSTAGSPLNKPLPLLPQREASALPISVTPSAADDVFFDATAPSTAAPSWPLPTDRQSVYGTELTHPPQHSPPLPPMPASRPVPSNSPAAGPIADPPTAAAEAKAGDATNTDNGGSSIGDSPTLVFNSSAATPSFPAMAARGRVPSGSSDLSMYGFHYYSPLDERVLDARLTQIRTTLGAGGNVDDHNEDNGNMDNGGGTHSSSSSASPKAVIGNCFVSPDDDDADAEEDLIAPLLPQNRFAGQRANSINRDSVASVMTDATGMSFVTAFEGVDDDDEDDEDDVVEEMEVEEGAAGTSSGHWLPLLSPANERLAHDIDDDDDDAEADITLVPAAREEESDVEMAGDEAEFEPDTFQIVSRDGKNTTVMADLDTAEEASSDDDSADCSDHSGAVGDSFSSKESIDLSEPLYLSHASPPELSTELAKGKVIWEYNPWSTSYDPKWTAEPDVEAIRNIARIHYKILELPNDNVTVEFLAEGSFNKAYTVTSTDNVTGALHECIFRCYLPIAPWYKLQSEVATMEFIRRTTTIPVPRVFAFDSSMENPFGLEWMLMEKINGRSYDGLENQIPFDTKVKLYRQAAEWIDQLSRLKFDSIGALYHDWSRSLAAKSSYKVGPLCTTDFIVDLRLDYAINRGPFTTFEQYYQAHISYTHHEAIDPRHKERVEACNKQEEMKAAGEEIAKKVPETNYTLDALSRIPKLCLALQSVLPTALSGKHLGPASTRLHHFDIAKRNILVDTDGNALALTGWETSCITSPDNIPRYPPLVNADDVREPPPPWDEGDEGKDEERLQEEKKAWEERLLRDAFDCRLKELASPHLEAGRGDGAELVELKTIVGALDSWDDFSFVERMREKMRRIF